MAYRKIPRQLITDRGAVVSKDIVHLADMELAKLEQELALAQQQFPDVQQLRRTRNFGHAIIECFAGFGLAWAKVTVGAGKGEERRNGKVECFCLPCFVQGYIKAVTYEDPCSYYDVEICQKTYKSDSQTGRYIEVQGVVSLDYALYQVGQPVLVSMVPCTSGSICGCDTGLTMCEVTAIPSGDLPCLLCIVPLHWENSDGGYARIPRWKQVENKWGILY